MKANELRIGNIIKQGTIKSFYEYGVHWGFGCSTKFSDIEPIELTEEWLVKFGFKDSGFATWSKNKITIRNPIQNIYKFRVSDSVGFVYIEYVHQLQNLYSALTGNELNIIEDE